MKRSTEQKAPPKRTKLDRTQYHDYDQVPFSDDALTLIMSFLWTRTLISSCLYVSRQWCTVVTERAEKQFTIKDMGTLIRFIESRFNQSDAPLSLTLSDARGVTDTSLFQGRTNIKRIDADFCDVTNIEHIKTLDNLESIRLMCCHLGLEWIGSATRLKKLKRIDVNFMKETKKDENTETASIEPSELTALERLTVSYSKISDRSFSEIVKLSQISHLDLRLSTGSMIGRSEHIAKLTNLTYLDLTGTGLADGDMLNLSNIDALLTLDISENTISTQGFSFLPRFKNLTRLEANGTQFDGEACLCLSTMIRLKSLSIERSCINEASCCDLSRLSGLHHLSVSNNRIGGNGLSHLCSMSNLNSLKVMQCSIDSESAKQIERLENLRHLEISIERRDGTIRLGKGLETLSVSKGLNRHLAINAELIEGLWGMRGLTSLCLSDMLITNEQSKGLVRLTRLTKLDVSKNSLGIEGALQISKIKTLVHLDISVNDIRWEGVKFLVLSLKNLWHLDISRCFVGDESIEYIAQAKNIESLVFVCSDTSREGKKVIRLMKNIVSLEL